MLGDLLQAHIRQLFEWVLPACLRFVRKNVKEIQPSLDTCLATACMRLFNSLLDDFRPSGPEEAPVPPKGKAGWQSQSTISHQGLTHTMSQGMYISLSYMSSCRVMSKCAKHTA